MKILATILYVLLGCVSQPGRSDHDDRSASSLRYYAEIRDGDERYALRGWLLFDRGKFRLAHRFPSYPRDKPPSRFEFYDGSAQEVVWSYDSNRKVAGPIGKGRSLSWGARPLPTFGHLTSGELQPSLDQWAKQGRASVAGHSCDVFEWRFPPSTTKFKRPDGLSLSSGPPRVQKAWVEPSSGLVLRLESETQSDQKGFPSMRRVYSIQKLTFLERIPAAKFELPPGSTVKLARRQAYFTTPKGVKRLITRSP